MVWTLCVLGGTVASQLYRKCKCIISQVVLVSTAQRDTAHHQKDAHGHQRPHNHSHSHQKKHSSYSASLLIVRFLCEDFDRSVRHI